ncbi:YeiH family protein [Zooshikella harenae]|uniref:YeiH family putative sulfate export transporter n=1 Tax=Zooshikella harenae TaxID=2827238 RepID=A0ABS5ZG27_9GAMM|nr:YeiH family protein [Zooshikella harenae]MBU2713003.1 YeiH family putative sulfate export transporter [Zooshikella harenae]
MQTIILLPLIAISAILLARIPQISALGLSPLPLAIFLGILLGHLCSHDSSSKAAPFLSFCQKKLLKLGIVLFGFSLSIQQIIAVGWQAIFLDIIIIITIFGIGAFIGIRILKLPRDVAILTSVGSAICGAAAILATEATLKARQQHVTTAIATVILFGTLAMMSYPIIYQYVSFNEQTFGIYIGSTVHEVAQAVAAGQSISADTMQTAVVVKLIRVMLLAPFILILSTLLSRINKSTHATSTTITIPWFVFWFILAAGINSYAELPTIITNTCTFSSQLLLSIAMAALGFQTNYNAIKSIGIKPILLASILFVLLLFGGFYLNQWLL